MSEAEASATLTSWAELSVRINALSANANGENGTLRALRTGSRMERLILGKACHRPGIMNKFFKLAPEKLNIPSQRSKR